MAYASTPWGYDVDGTLPSLLTVADFNALTGGKWANDARIEPTIAAASAAIRAWCGWHVYPSMTCQATLDSDGSRSLWLPTTHLTGVTALEVGGTATTDYQWSRLGQVLPADAVPCGLQAAEVTYTAGYGTLPADVALMVKDMVVRSVALSYGVTSESAGDVSVSYATNAAYASAGASMTDADHATLAPYKAVRAHAV